MDGLGSRSVLPSQRSKYSAIRNCGSMTCIRIARRTGRAIYRPRLVHFCTEADLPSSSNSHPEPNKTSIGSGSRATTVLPSRVPSRSPRSGRWVAVHTPFFTRGDRRMALPEVVPPRIHEVGPRSIVARLINVTFQNRMFAQLRIPAETDSSDGNHSETCTENNGVRRTPTRRVSPSASAQHSTMLTNSTAVPTFRRTIRTPRVCGWRVRSD